MNDKGREEARHKGRYEDSDGSALDEQGESNTFGARIRRGPQN